jgi:hypothetical protein
MRRLFFLLAVGALAAGLTMTAGSGTKVARASHLSRPSALAIQPVSAGPTQPVSAGFLSSPCNALFGCDPPLIYHGGPLMGTPSNSPIVITPIFWHPAGHPMPNQYTNIINRYLSDVAAASGTHSNVFSTMNEYADSSGQKISYQLRLGRAIDDTAPLPTNADSCTVGSLDTTGIYKDGSGYDACVSDLNVQAEVERVITANNLPVDFGHEYVLYLPQHVESCFNPGDSTNPDNGTNACTINHYPTSAYCAYHFITQDPTSAIYANMPFPIYQGSIPSTCGSNSNRNFGTIESPNGNPDADVEISPTSHEIMESITDPDTVTGYYDAHFLENGDECAYVYGPTAGKPGALWNQTIHNHHYLTQEEFSNADFNASGRGCRQTEFGF